jgi:hypothetical protein
MLLIVSKCLARLGDMHTFQELLAGVLLEQRLVSDWSVQVVDEELEDGLDFLLSVASELSECLVLRDN